MNKPFTMDRRKFIQASGGFLAISFAIGGRAFAAGGGELPRDLDRNPSLDSWIRIGADGTVTLLIGKVELGQGSVTAAAQCCCDELGISWDRINVISGDTTQGPDEGTTAGSSSSPNCMPAVQQASAEVRKILVDMAATKLGVDAGSLSVSDGTISGSGKSVTYWDLVDGLDLNVDATGNAELIPVDQHHYIGGEVGRLDIPAKMTGEQIFVQEMNPEGVVFGAVARPPTYRATLKGLDLSAIESMPGVIKVIRNGSFLGVVAEHQDQAWAAADAMEKQSEWSIPSDLPTSDGIYNWLMEDGAWKETVYLDQKREGGGEPAKTYEQTYLRPYQMHGSIGTSAAVAQLDESTGETTIYTHSQSVFSTGAAIAKMLGVDESKIHCIHTQGAGCYGHNNADDAAADAALLAQAVPGRPVKLQYTRAHEHRWEPYGSAMAVTVSASVDADGNVLDWAKYIYSTTHSTRPGGDPGHLLSGRYLDPPFELKPGRDFGGPNYGSARNGIPDYEFPGMLMATRFRSEMPVRVSAHRGLGAYANVFAHESFMDELAHEAGVDPLEYRLRFLKDERRRAVLMKAAELFGWDKWEGGRGRGRGIAVAQYKNHAAYTAVAVEVQVIPRNGRVRVIRAAAANDSGSMINPNNIANQIEGGIIQSASWTLKEEVKFDDTRILSSDWQTYPILTFNEVPNVEVALIDRPGEPYLGTGETAMGPTAGAIANAVFDAVGARVRRLPLTPDRVKAAMNA
jgi:nicotinate dehydrogenase subunit B